MKILAVCQHYEPEPFRFTDICEELARRGHDVTVVTGIPNYPMGEIYDGYRNGQKRDEIIRNVKVHRCFTIGRKHSIVYRVLNYYSYMFSSTWYVKRLSKEYDVVLVNQLSPVMMANAGVQYKKKHHVPLVMYCLDLWPESLVVGGVSRGSLIYKYYHWISKRIYMQADKIFVSSKLFANYFEKEFGISDTVHLPQYAEAGFTQEQCEKKPDGYLDLMFAGNVGMAQSVETIVEAAKLTADIPNIRWHIVGEGSELEKVRTMAKGIERIIFHGRKSLEEMPQYYAMADAMLVTMQKNPVLSLTLPGKVQTYMAAGKPMIGAIDGETASVIANAGCGICSGAEDAQALAENVRKFVGMDKASMGANAKKYYDEHFEKQIFMDRLEKGLSLEKEFV